MSNIKKYRNHITWLVCALFVGLFGIYDYQYVKQIDKLQHTTGTVVDVQIEHNGLSRRDNTSSTTVAYFVNGVREFGVEPQRWHKIGSSYGKTVEVHYDSQDPRHVITGSKLNNMSATIYGVTLLVAVPIVYQLYKFIQRNRAIR